jgi:hypothetical protein
MSFSPSTADVVFEEHKFLNALYHSPVVHDILQADERYTLV